MASAGTLDQLLDSLGIMSKRPAITRAAWTRALRRQEKRITLHGFMSEHVNSLLGLVKSAMQDQPEGIRRLENIGTGCL